MAFHDYTDGLHWVFFTFTRPRSEALFLMLTEAAGDVAGKFFHFPAGTPLFDGKECFAWFVPKARLPAAALARGLRKHFGYENPDPHNDVFTLGDEPRATSVDLWYQTEVARWIRQAG